MSPDRIFYLNTLFDLELGGFSTSKVRQSAAEMSILFAPLLAAGDRLLVAVTVPPAFWDYLQHAGFSISQQQIVHVGDVASTPVVWGWNSAAAALLSVAICPEAFPPFETVKEINNRRFCSHLATELGCGVPGSRFCASPDAIEQAVRELLDSAAVVVKAAFGGSGSGIRVIRHLADLEQTRALFDGYCNHGGVVVEPWLNRSYDLSTAAMLGKNGSIESLWFQRLGVNDHGAFYSIFVTKHDQLIEPWRGELTEITRRIIQKVAQTGYFGPVGIDSFVYTSASGEQQLAAAIEINGRYTMGILAQLMRQRYFAGKALLFRVLSRRHCCLPDTIEEWELLVKTSFKPLYPDVQLLMLTPPRVGFETWWGQPARSVFIIVAPTEETVFFADQALRDMLARKKS